MLARAVIDKVRTQNVDALIGWRFAVRAGLENPLRRFVITLDHDQAAVHNALTHAHSNGPTRGHVNRLKLLKRSANGRASFQLLRRKVLHQLA